MSVADWAETPTLTPAASDGHPLGDRNDNGLLDAGDLILNFSDGIDDDGNGYVDDISGWDFMKDDNDPYDDTRYGHGTGEARDSTSRANNGIGSAGGCNECRVLHLRVGDSFITDVNDFAQAVIFATDSGASIVQSALGTVNNNAYTQTALDYAYANGVLTVASMADENSRHHNMPTASNHTLPVHAIQYSGGAMDQARTYFQYHPCSNFGGQNFLSGSGRACSSEAVGQTSGIAGLLYAAGLKYAGGLSAGEAMQLLTMSTDDVDVPESRKVDALDRWSQPGFDQRFGYGRVNANRAVEMVKDGKIPPEVDVVSPHWFEVLYKDQVTGPVEIRGTVQAKRASNYDVFVEWAPGVQPLDGEFTVIKEAKAIASDVVTGGDEPLAALDIRNLDGFPIPQEKWDSDSLLGENQHTITVRVRSVAHYGGSVGDVKGEMRRTYYVHSDPDLVKGFPIYVGSGGEGSPKTADIDGDGIRDLIYPTAAGELHVFKLTGSSPSPLPGFPFKTRIMDGNGAEQGEPSYLAGKAFASGAVDPTTGRESISSNAPAIADLDGDGKNEIVFTTYAGTIYVVNGKGEALAPWPKRLPRVPSCSLDPSNPTPQPCMSTASRIARGAFAAPVLEDLDQDGDLDIIQAAFDGKIYVFDKDGNDLPGFPVDVAYDGEFGGSKPPSNRIFTTPAVRDLNGDGIPELVVGSNQKIGEGGNSGAVYAVDGRGTNAPSLYLPNWPVTMTSLNLFPLVAEGITNSTVIETFEGQPAAVVHGNASAPLILPTDQAQRHPAERDPAAHGSPDGRARSVEHVRHAHERAAAEHDAAALLAALRRRHGPRRHARRARLRRLAQPGNQPPVAVRQPEGREPLRGLERQDGQDAPRVALPARGLHLPQQLGLRRPHERRLPRGARWLGWLLPARLRRLRPRAPGLAEVHGPMDHQHARRGRPRRRRFARGRRRDAQWLALRLAHDGHDEQPHPVGELPPRQPQHGRPVRRARAGWARDGDAAAHGGAVRDDRARRRRRRRRHLRRRGRLLVHDGGGGQPLARGPGRAQHDGPRGEPRGASPREAQPRVAHERVSAIASRSGRWLRARTAKFLRILRVR